MYIVQPKKDKNILFYIVLFLFTSVLKFVIWKWIVKIKWKKGKNKDLDN